MMPDHNSIKPLIAVSGCLLGDPVRYDGTDKHNDLICNHLSTHFEMIAVCPEVGAGLGTPRPPIKLTGNPLQPRALGVENPRLDVTSALTSFANSWLAQAKNISGAILKSRSPSCGLWDAPIFDPHDQVQSRGPGLFTQTLIQHYPQLPISDEAEITDPKLRNAFISNIKLFAAWQRLLKIELTTERLLNFHHHQLPPSLSQSELTTLNHTLEQLSQETILATANTYFQLLMATVNKHNHKPETEAHPTQASNTSADILR